MTELETEPSSCLNCGGDRADLPRPTPCRYCGATYAACVDGEACCKACLHTDGHAALAAGRETTRTEWGIRHSSGAVRWPNEESCRHHAAQHGGTVVSRHVTTITTEWEEATDAAGREATWTIEAEGFDCPLCFHGVEMHDGESCRS